MYAIRSYYDDVQTRRTVLDLQHEGYAQQANYSKKFEETPRAMPFGEAPVVLAKARGKRRDTGTQVLSLRITSYNVCYTKLLRNMHTTPNSRIVPIV